MISACNNNNKDRLYVPVSLNVIDHMNNVLQNHIFTLFITNIVDTSSSVSIIICLAMVCKSIVLTPIGMNVWIFYMKISVGGPRMSKICIIWINIICCITRKMEIYIIMLKVLIWCWRLSIFWNYWRNIILSYKNHNGTDISKMEMMYKVIYMVWLCWTSKWNFYRHNVFIVTLMETFKPSKLIISLFPFINYPFKLIEYHLIIDILWYSIHLFFGFIYSYTWELSIIDIYIYIYIGEDIKFSHICTYQKTN